MSTVSLVIVGIFIGERQIEISSRQMGISELVSKPGEEQQVTESDALKKLSEELQNVKNQFASQLDSLTNISETASVSNKLTEIENTLSNFEKQIDILNKVILKSPEKALEIPMLKEILRHCKVIMKARLNP